MKLIIITDRQPWFDDAPLAKGTILTIEDETVAKHFVDNDFALPLPEEAAPAPAPAEEPKPAPAAKAKNA